MRYGEAGMRKKTQRIVMAVLAGIMALLMLLPIVANIFVH